MAIFAVTVFLAMSGVIPGTPAVCAANLTTAGDNVTWLTVDGVVYTRGEISVYANEILGKDATEDREVARYVNELVLDLIGYDEAIEEMPALADDPRVKSEVRRFAGKQLKDILFDEIRKTVVVTRDDMMKETPDPAPQFDVAVIVNEDEGRIKAAQAALASGKTFEAAAKEYSDGMTADKGGVIGRIEEGRSTMFTDDEFAVIRSLKDGEVSKPFKTRIGWMLARLRKLYSSRELKEARVDAGLDAFRADKERDVLSKFMADLAAKAVIAWDNAVLEKTRQALESGAPMDDALKASALATIDGRPIYVFELVPLSSFHSIDSLDRYVDKRVREEIAVAEAVKRGYDKPLRKLIEIATKRAVTRNYIRTKAMGRKISDAEIRDYYEKHPERFQTGDRKKLRVVQTADEAKAKDVAARAAKGADFAALAAEFNDSEEHRKIKGEMGYVERKRLQPEVGNKVFAARDGDVVGPLAVAGANGASGFVVVKVEGSVKSETIPLEKLNRDIVIDRVVSERQEAFLKDFLGKKQGEKHRIETHFSFKGEGAQKDGKHL